MILHGFSRSSASWRVRIALNLKGLEPSHVSYKLREKEQHTAAYKSKNPQFLVPTLELDDGRDLTQSLAIIEYLDELYPEPALLPDDPFLKAQIRAFAQIICCDIHPIQNLKILQRIDKLADKDGAKMEWASQVILEGFDAIEAILEKGNSIFCFGDSPTIADICLIPQVGNARRFGMDLKWPRINAVVEACETIPEFSKAAPEMQQ